MGTGREVRDNGKIIGEKGELFLFSGFVNLGVDKTCAERSNRIHSSTPSLTEE